MAVITVFNQKGGKGASTISMALYHAFIRSDVSTLIIDTDPQQSTFLLSSQVTPPINVITKINKKDIEKHSLTIIDTPPNFDAARKAIDIGTMIIAPLRPSQVDLLATIEARNTIKKHYPNKPFYALLNCNIANTPYPMEVIKALKDNDVKVLNSAIGNRLDFARTFEFEGNIYKSKNTKAKSEIDALALEIYGKLI